MSSKELVWMKTSKTLILSVEGRIYNVLVGSEQYKKIMSILAEDNGKERVDDIITIIDMKKNIEKYTDGRFTVSKEKKIVDTKTNHHLHPVFVEKIKDFVKNGYSYKAFVKFWDNLMMNPNQNSIDQLYRFLEANNMPITYDGCFLAYKRVKTVDGKLVDDRTGTFDNSIGKVVVMDREACDSDPDRTCSTGLHVAAFGYAKDYSGDTLIEVKVNPKDVVAVPTDYNNQKMRVCRYEVVAVGSEEVKKSYLSAKFIAGKVEEAKKTSEKIVDGVAGIESMSASQIIAYVKEKTGHVIDINVKSKKSIVKKALELLGLTKSSTFDTIDLTDKSASQIVEIVFKQTGYKIGYSLKSKQSIVKKAASVLGEHGLIVKV